MAVLRTRKLWMISQNCPTMSPLSMLLGCCHQHCHCPHYQRSGKVSRRHPPPLQSSVPQRQQTEKMMGPANHTGSNNAIFLCHLNDETDEEDIVGRQLLHKWISLCRAKLRRACSSTFRFAFDLSCKDRQRLAQQSG